jgi:hypothetical protein
VDERRRQELLRELAQRSVSPDRGLDESAAPRATSKPGPASGEVTVTLTREEASVVLGEMEAFEIDPNSMFHDEEEARRVLSVVAKLRAALKETDG